MGKREALGLTAGVMIRCVTGALMGPGQCEIK